MRAYKAWHCNEFQNYCCLCYSCHCAKMGVTSNHWSRALIESIVTTLLQENQEINDSLKEYGVLKARILKWFAIPFSSGPHFVRTLHHDPSVLGGPTRHGSQFHWVRQGCDPCDEFGYFSVIFILSVIWWMRIRGLWKLPDGRHWLWGKLGLALVGKVILSISLIYYGVISKMAEWFWFIYKASHSISQQSKSRPNH